VRAPQTLSEPDLPLLTGTSWPARLRFSPLSTGIAQRTLWGVFRKRTLTEQPEADLLGPGIGEEQGAQPSPVASKDCCKYASGVVIATA
jgi:hypothetical protein